MCNVSCAHNVKYVYVKGIRFRVIVVGKLVCVSNGNSWSGQDDNRNQGKPSPGAMPSQGVGGGGGSIAPPRGR
jgi:hypothetical protein